MGHAYSHRLRIWDMLVVFVLVATLLQIVGRLPTAACVLIALFFASYYPQGK